MDFKHPPALYDTFALRDWDGHEPMMQIWPYFYSSVSLSAMMTNQPIPVTSCWNGMGIPSNRYSCCPLLTRPVAMDAAPFYDESEPLRFRGVPDTLAERHVEGSECCLIHADNSLSPKKGVFINPAVRVGYTPEAYETVHTFGSSQWVSPASIAAGLWKNRFKRWLGTSFFKEGVVRRRVNAWERTAPGRKSIGTFCLIDEMQVMFENGWQHV